MNYLSQEAIQEFIEIYKAEYGEELPYAEAEERAAELLTFYSLILPSPWSQITHNYYYRTKELKGFLKKWYGAHQLILLCNTKTAPSKKQFYTYLISNFNLLMLTQNVKQTIKEIRKEFTPSGVDVHVWTQTPVGEAQNKSLTLKLGSISTYSLTN